jgi:hypothetical protein
MGGTSLTITKLVRDLRLKTHQACAITAARATTPRALSVSWWSSPAAPAPRITDPGQVAPDHGTRRERGKRGRRILLTARLHGLRRVGAGVAPLDGRGRRGALVAELRRRTQDGAASSAPPRDGSSALLAELRPVAVLVAARRATHRALRFHRGRQSAIRIAGATPLIASPSPARRAGSRRPSGRSGKRRVVMPLRVGDPLAQRGVERVVEERGPLDRLAIVSGDERLHERTRKAGCPAPGRSGFVLRARAVVLHQCT